jgi:hypothetical protein
MNIHAIAASAPPSAEILLNEREAGRRLSLSTRTLFTLRQSDGLPHVKIGSKVLYRPADLERYFASRVVEAGK